MVLLSNDNSSRVIRSDPILKCLNGKKTKSEVTTEYFDLREMIANTNLNFEKETNNKIAQIVQNIGKKQNEKTPIIR